MNFLSDEDAEIGIEVIQAVVSRLDGALQCQRSEESLRHLIEDVRDALVGVLRHVEGDA